MLPKIIAGSSIINTDLPEPDTSPRPLLPTRPPSLATVRRAPSQESLAPLSEIRHVESFIDRDTRLVKADQPVNSRKASVCIYLNGKLANSEIMRRRDSGSSDSSGMAASVDVSLLSPATNRSRKTSISSLETDLQAYLSQYKDSNDDFNPDEFIVEHREFIHSFLSEGAVIQLDDFTTKWDRLLRAYCHSQASALVEYHKFNVLARRVNPGSVQEILGYLDNTMRFIISQIKLSFRPDQAIPLLSGSCAPVEIQMLYDLNRLRINYWHCFPREVTDGDIVGCVVKKRQNGLPVHINIIERGFIARQSELGITDIRFLICEIADKMYLLKPFKNYMSKGLLSAGRKIPKLLTFMDIQLNDNKMIERNIIAYQVSQILGLQGSVPEIRNIVYAGRRYMGVELKLATTLVEFDRQERSQLYKIPAVTRDMYSKQLLDCLLGNCDANITNLLINIERPCEQAVIGIDYDLSLSGNFTDIQNVECLLKDRKSSFMIAELHKASYYRGVPDFIDVDLARRISEVNEWDYFNILLTLNHTPSIITNLKRLIDLKASIASEAIKTITDWNEAYSLVRKMSKGARRRKTYFL